MKKTCIRKVAIREKEFNEILKPQALDCGYTSVEWIPYSMNSIAGEVVFMILKEHKFDGIFLSDKDLKEHEYNRFPIERWKSDNLEHSSRLYMHYLQYGKKLYNSGYKNWHWKFEDDSIHIRAYKNHVWQKLGLAVLKREYEI
jgi:hypothetical protein